MLITEHEPLESVHAKLVSFGGCTPIEAKTILDYVHEYPAKGTTPHEAQRGVAMAILLNRELRLVFLERALLTHEEKMRERELDAAQVRIARLNAFYPDSNAGRDALEAAREAIATLWPDAHDARVMGALYLSFFDTGSSWSFDGGLAARSMRETADADRAWKGGF